MEILMKFIDWIFVSELWNDSSISLLELSFRTFRANMIMLIIAIISWFIFTRIDDCYDMNEILQPSLWWIMISFVPVLNVFAYAIGGSIFGIIMIIAFISLGVFLLNLLVEKISYVVKNGINFTSFKKSKLGKRNQIEDWWRKSTIDRYRDNPMLKFLYRDYKNFDIFNYVDRIFESEYKNATLVFTQLDILRQIDIQWKNLKETHVDSEIYNMFTDSLKLISDNLKIMCDDIRELEKENKENSTRQAEEYSNKMKSILEFMNRDLNEMRIKDETKQTKNNKQFRKVPQTQISGSFNYSLFNKQTDVN